MGVKGFLEGVKWPNRELPSSGTKIKMRRRRQRERGFNQRRSQLERLYSINDRRMKCGLWNFGGVTNNKAKRNTLRKPSFRATTFNINPT